MLVGIIKDKNTLYHVYSEKKDSNLSWYVEKCCDNTVSVLDYDSAMKMFNNLFDSNLSYLEKYNDYYVFLDESNNKRYFKDDIEDLNMFFIHNGVDALEYGDDKEGCCKRKKAVKKFTFRKDVAIICGSFLFVIFAPSIGVNLYDIGNKYVKPYTVSINYDKVDTMICNSNHLSDDEKKFLCNEDYLRDVLKYSPAVRNYSLKEKFNDIDIDSFSKEDLDYCVGYYSPIEVNKLYVRDDYMNNDENYYDILAHEFVHLTQTNYTKYNYVHEACAEILSYEYYGTKVNAYPDFVKRVKVLMEIIGPEPILQCNFNSDEAIEESIKQYLTDDEAETLFDCLRTTGTMHATMSGADIGNINSKVDYLLGVMYFNKTGENIENDKVCNLIYNNNEFINQRYYFNKNKEQFYKPTNIGNTLSVCDYDDVMGLIKNDKVSKYRWSSNQYYSEDEYNNLDDSDNHECIGFYYEMVDGVTYDFYATDERAYLYNGHKYSEDELLANGLIYSVFNVIDTYELEDYDCIIPHKKDVLTVIYDNDFRLEFDYDELNDCWSGKGVRVYNPILAESIYDKFNDQFTDINVSENENHIRK